MSQVCEFTGKRPQTGNTVSHSNRKVKTRWVPNLFTKRYHVPELKKTLKIQLSSRAIRNIDKQGGITKALLKARPEELSAQLLRARRELERFNGKGEKKPA